MAKDDSVVKSFRTTEEQFGQAVEIFKKEGFSFSEVVRLLFEATIREGRIPRGLATRDMEPQADAFLLREQYVDHLLNMAIPGFDGQYKTAEEALLSCIFGEKDQTPDTMSNAQLREWGSKWGLPDTLSVSTLADLYQSGFLKPNPWDGTYNAVIDAGTSSDMMLHICEENLKENLEDVLSGMRKNAVTALLYDFTQEQTEEDMNDEDE